MKNHICTHCGHVGKPIPQSKESFFVDAFIWGIVGSFALMTGVMPVLIIPAAWSVYHILKFNTTKCPECLSLDMVGMNSRKGREMQEYKKDPIQVWNASDDAPSASEEQQDFAVPAGELYKKAS